MMPLVIARPLPGRSNDISIFLTEK